MSVIPQDISPRQEYLRRILPFVGKQVIKVLTGQRRVGKSYLLFQLIREIQKTSPDHPIIYINREDINFAWMKNAVDLHQYVKDRQKPGCTNHVFIDEIQDIDEFGQALRSLALDDGLDIYCTGSNATLLSGDVAGHLSGRYIEFKVYSLSYAEFLQFHLLEDSPASLNKYLKYGGLPYLKHLPLEDEVVFEYLKNIYTTIVYRDIVNRYGIRNTGFLEQLVQFLASNVGSIFSANRISDFLKSQKITISHNQVQTYTDYLVNAFLVHKVGRYDVAGKQLFGFGNKFYFENLGIRHGIWGFRPEDLGKIIENAVFNHLQYKGYEVKVGVIAQEEIDFVCQKDGETEYFQVALSLHEQKTIQREFGNLQKVNDNYPKTVITLDRFDGNTYAGIMHTDLRSFLMG